MRRAPGERDASLDAVIAAARAAHPEASTTTAQRPNVLVLIADDVGQDMVGAYGVHPGHPATPRIDALAAGGVTFRQAIADPVCSPTRATLVTGRYAWRYGIGNAIPPRPGWGLPADERLLPTALREGTDGAYTSVVVGKWHLATPDMGGYDHPRRAGFDHHVGTMGNLLGYTPDGEPQSYEHWTRVVDGQVEIADGYVTSATIDDTLRLARELPEPWFLFVGFHAGHYPMHEPPSDLYTTPLPPQPSEGDLYRAMVEALDTELGRLLDGIAPMRDRTEILFLGDNGSAPTAVEPPWHKGQAKGQLSRGGIRVPFVWAGPSVAEPGRATDALVNTSDLYATVVQLAGIDEPWPDDSLGFAEVLRDPTSRGPRRVAYAERFGPNGPSEAWTYHEAIVRDDRFKLLVRNGLEDAMFDLLEGDGMERRNLFRQPPTPEMRTALRELRRAVPDVAWVERSGERPRGVDVEQ